MKKNAFQPKKNVPTIAQLVRPTEPGIILFEQIDPDVLAYGPIHFYLRPWCDGRYSCQTLHRMLTDVIDQEFWHALKGVEEHRALHASNTTLVEALLRQLTGQDEQRVQVMAA